MDTSNIDKLLGGEIYSSSDVENDAFFLKVMQEVTLYHYENCGPYRKICDKREFDPGSLSDLVQLPILPASIFKKNLLVSVPQDEIFREINSSATTSGQPSRMALDRATSRRQTKCFNKVILNRIGTKRRKFIVLDEPSTIERSALVSARSSTIKSLLFCANEVYTCIENDDGKLSLNQAKLEEYLREAEQKGDELILFGFTFILYAYVVRELLKAKKKYKLPSAKIVHIGGWKKLQSEMVTPEQLVKDCSETFGVNPSDVIDIYGFTEQSGLIYPTCEAGVRHVPQWAKIIVRDPVTLKPVGMREKGLLQFLTPIQTSYPGHCVLTEDIGYIASENKCECGRRGLTFRVVDRAPGAEIRGCGDIMSEKFA